MYGVRFNGVRKRLRFAGSSLLGLTKGALYSEKQPDFNASNVGHELK